MPETPHSPTGIKELTEQHLVRHLSTAFSDTPIAVDLEASLPYRELGGPGLERLCYLILLSDGVVPRLFGKNGQPQYGIDLLAKTGESYAVYQCKNLKRFRESDMRAALERFEGEWLGRKSLPKPRSFTLCCPVDLRDVRQASHWLSLQAAFTKRTGVELEFWDQTFLDERLRRSPDLVADLFSNSIVERFCDVEEWNDDLFEPVGQPSGSPVLSQYLRLREAGQLYLPTDVEDFFFERLEDIGALLVRGPAGSGKSISSIALAACLGPTAHRVYYTDLRYDCSEQITVRGIRRRLSHPSVFILDNCEQKTEVALRVHQRVFRRTSGLNRQPKVVYLYRSGADPSETFRGASELEGYFEEDEAVLELQSTPERTRSILELQKPNFSGLSSTRLKRLSELTAHDLTLLDSILEGIEEPSEIDALEPSDLLERFLKRYFGRLPVVKPCIHRVAALAQFDITPEVSSIEGDALAEADGPIDQLLGLAGRPPRYCFPHASIAELLFRSLCWAQGQDDIVPPATKFLVEYFEGLDRNSRTFHEALSNLLGRRLRLGNDTDDARIKAEVLSHPSVYAAFETNVQKWPLSILGLGLVILHEERSRLLDSYREIVDMRVESGEFLSQALSSSTDEFLRFLRITQSRFPEIFSHLQEQVQRSGVGSLVTNGDFVSVISVLAELVDGRAEWLSALEGVGNAEADLLIERAIGSDRPLGLYQLALGRLRSKNPDFCGRLEEIIGHQRLLRLTQQRGTLSDLFRLVENSTQAEPLVRSIDETLLRSLLLRTTKTGASIAMLPHSIRRLGSSDPEIAELLHQRITPEGYAEFIKSVGGVTDLVRVCASLPADVARGLVDAFDGEAMDALTAQTLTNGRSIGTIALGFRQLRASDPELADRLEHLVSAGRYLHLILEAGTVFELFRVFDSSSPEMIRSLVGRLDAAAGERLVARTIAGDRPIGTLHLGLRRLGEVDVRLLRRVEQVLGVLGYRRLLREQGTIGDLVRVAAVSSREMARSVVEALTASEIEAMVERTLSRERGFGTLGLGLRELRKGNQDLGRLIEEKIRGERYVRMLEEIGTLPNLTTVLQSCSKSFAKEILEQLEESVLDRVISRTIVAEASIAAIPLNLRGLETTSPELFARLEEKIGPERWIHLVSSLGSFVDLMTILSRSSAKLSSLVIARLNDELLDALCERAVSDGRTIGTLPLWFKGIRDRSEGNLRQLESKIGVKRMARLIVTLGDIQVLAGAMQRVSGEFRSLLWPEIMGSPVEHLAGVLRRSRFVMFGRLARRSPGVLSRFLSVLPGDVTELAVKNSAGQASWEDLSQGVSELEQAPGSDVTELALNAATARVSEAELEEDSRSSFASGAAQLGLRWWLQPERRLSWVQEVLELLPEIHTWVEDAEFLRWWSEVLRILTDPALSEKDVWRVLAIGEDPRVLGLVREASGYQVFYCCWRLFVLLGVRGRQKRDLRDFLGPAVVSEMLASIQDRVPVLKDLFERDVWLALVGVLDAAQSIPKSWRLKRFQGTRESISRLSRRPLLHRPEIAICLLLGLERVLGQPVHREMWQRISLKTVHLRDGDAETNELRSIVRSRA